MLPFLTIVKSQFIELLTHKLSYLTVGTGLWTVRLHRLRNFFGGSRGRLPLRVPLIDFRNTIRTNSSINGNLKIKILLSGWQIVKALPFKFEGSAFALFKLIDRLFGFAGH